MKQFILLLLPLLFTGLAQAQDIILKTSGDELHVKVTEITLTDILYKESDSLQAPLFSLPKAEVFMIKYANGAKEIIAPLSPEASAGDYTLQSRRQMYEKGQQDARRYYKGNNAMWGAAGATLVLGIPGPILIGAIPPKIKVREVPQVSLLQDPDYTQGYKDQAHRKKIRKAAAGAGIGTGAIIFIIFVALSGNY
jgi:hypothetical protein